MKKLLLLSIALLLIAGIYADVIIGTGTSTGRYPLNDYFVYSRSQCIYTAAEVGVPAGGTITHLRWYRDDTGADPDAIGTTEIWLAETTLTTLSTWQTEGTLVATISNIDLGAGGDWYEVDIDDFTYTGSNLMVSVRTQNAPFTTPHAYWRYTSTSPDYRSLLGNNDSTNPPTVSTSYYRPNITLVGITQTSPPGICSLVFPTPSGVTGVSITPTLSWAAGSGTPTGYDVYFGETLPAEGSPNVDHTVQTGTTWAPGTLSYSTEYSWKIVPWNANGHPAYGDCPTWTFTTMDDPTVTEFPWNEYFDSVTAPALPTGWLSLDNNADGDKWITYATNPYSSPNAAMIYTDYNSSNDDYLVTPPLVLTGNQRLKFWTRAQSASEPDEISILLSTTTPTAGAFTNVLMASTAINFITYTEYTVDLSAYSGTCYISFTRKDTPADGWRLYVDNVLVENIPEIPIFTITPELTEAWPFGDVQIGSTVKKQFTITNTGVGSLDISDISTSDTYYGVEEIEPIDHALAANESTSFYATFSPLAVGGPYTGTVTITWSSGAKDTYTIDFTGNGVDYTIYAEDLPYPQNFDDVTAPALPPDWSKQVASSSTYAYVQTYAYGTPYSTPNHAYLTNSSDTAADLVLISPLIDPDLTTLRVRFWAKGSTGYTLQVGTMDGAGSKAAFTNLQTIDLTSTYTEYTVSFDAYAGSDQYIAFKHGLGGTYRSIYIDNVTIETIPLTGVLQVTPDPVECGTYYVGLSKPVTVTLSNVGAQPFEINTISLSDDTDFNLTGLPTLPYELGVGLSVPITVNFAPTIADILTTNLLINDTRLESSTVVNGIGVQPLVGEICENPYLVTLPLVDYAGTTAGYANDYTSAMFTGLGSTYYVNGKDWVAKVTIPSAGLLDISLADQSGYSSQYMGMFLVNTIPSLASPAAVLAQAYGNTTPLGITDAMVSAGDYYLIVDNWPSPADVYFVLNMAFEAVTTPPDPATLVSPADAGTNIGLGQTLNWTSGGGYVEGYRLSFGTVDPYAVLVDDVDLELVTTYDPELAYSTEYWWTVTPYNFVGDAVDCPTWSFTTMDDPTIFVPDTYTMDFETWPPLGWDLTGGTYSFVQYTDAGSNHWAEASFWGQSSGNTDIMTTPPIVASENLDLLFDWSHLYNTSYPNDALAVYMSEDLENWGTAIWSKSGTELNSGDGATSTAPGTGVTEIVSIPLTESTTFYIRFLGTSGYGPDLFLDNVVVRVTPTEVLAPILDYPDDTATLLPVGGFDFAWHQDANSVTPDSYKLYMSQNPATVLTDIVYTGITGTSFDPTQADPPVTYAYDQVWYWTVGSVKDADEEIATAWSFTIQPDPMVYEEDLPWCDGFESYDNFSIDWWRWTNVDVDLSDTYGMNDIDWLNEYLAQAFIIYTPSATTPALELEAHGGDKMAACFAATTPPNNDWLITPPIEGVSGLEASFWAMSYTDEYGLERFNVGVSTTGTDPEDFTIISGETYTEADTTWTQYTYPLEYPGQTIYVGIQCVSSDAFFLLIDDFCLYQTLDAPEVTIALTEGVPTVSWTAVEGASLYEVYGSVDPVAADPWTLLTDPGISGTEYQYAGTDAYHFFKVKALSGSKREAVPAKKTGISPRRETKQTNPMLRK